MVISGHGHDFDTRVVQALSIEGAEVMSYSEAPLEEGRPQEGLLRESPGEQRQL